MKTNNHKLLKTNRIKLMKTNKPYTRNHTTKHTTTCNEVQLGSDAQKADVQMRATCEARLYYCFAKFIFQ